MIAKLLNFTERVLYGKIYVLESVFFKVVDKKSIRYLVH